MMASNKWRSLGTSENWINGRGVEDVDFLSNLPDGVLIHIIGFLPLKSAIKTSVLSSRWRTLWMSTPSLDFEEVNISRFFGKSRRRDQFVRIIERILEMHQGAVRRFRLYFCPVTYSSYIDRWISFLANHGIEELVLDFWYGERPYKYLLPPSFYSCETLRVVKLRSCIFLPLVNFRSSHCLQTLSISNLNLTDNEICSIFSKFPVLDNLTLKYCYGFREIDISSPDSKLRYLVLDHCEDIPTINAPRLQTFDIRGYSASFILVDDSSLVNATIRPLRYNTPHHKDAKFMVENLKKMTCLEHLALIGSAIECLAAGEFQINFQQVFNYLKTLHVEVCLLDNDQSAVVAHLLGKCPKLHTPIFWSAHGSCFHQNHFTIHDDQKESDEQIDHSLSSNTKASCYRKLLANYWEPIIAGLSHHVHTVVIKNFEGRDFEYSFVKLLLMRSRVLQRLIVNSEEYLLPKDKPLSADSALQLFKQQPL